MGNRPDVAPTQVTLCSLVVRTLNGPFSHGITRSISVYLEWNKALLAATTEVSHIRTMLIIYLEDGSSFPLVLVVNGK